MQFYFVMALFRCSSLVILVRWSTNMAYIGIGDFNSQDGLMNSDPKHFASNWEWYLRLDR